MARDEDSPNSTPATVPYTAAFRDRPRLPNTSRPAHSATMRTMVTAHWASEAFAFPPAGSPKITKRLSPRTMATAPDTSRRPTRWLVRKYPSGRTKTTLETSSGWMTERRPRSSAPAWKR